MNRTPLEQELLMFVNDTPVVQGCLYDLDMLPEQLTHATREWNKMLIIIAHFKAASEAMREKYGI